MNELLVIGCRAGSPGKEGPASGYVLFTQGRTLLIDCGPGVVAALAARNLIARLDAVIVTHGHADHCADLVALAYHRLFPARMTPLPLYGPAQLEGVLRAVDKVFGIASLPALVSPLATALPFTALAPGEAYRVASIEVRTHRMLHPVETLALRFPELGFTYSSDGALSPELQTFAAGSAVLVCEATYVQAEANDLAAHGHMTAGNAGQLATAAGASTLILTHLADSALGDATLAAARCSFAGRAVLATAGMRLELGHDR